MAVVGGLARGAVIAVAVLALSGCHRAGEQAYRASVECAANEHVLQDFIDQNYDPAKMQPAEGSRTLAFNRSALRRGQVTGRSGGEVKIDVWERIAALRERYRKIGFGIAAGDALRLSNACQQKFGEPVGAHAYRPETIEPRKRAWQE